MMKVLIVDDHKSARRLLKRIIATMPEVEIFEGENLEQGRSLIHEHQPDVGLFDIRLSDDTRNQDGISLVREMIESQHGVPICVTAMSEMGLIRQAIRAGAYDYILKDELCDELILPLLEGLASRRALEREVATLRARARPPKDLGLIGSSAPMERLRKLIQRVALSDRPVLVTGPTGAGKEVVVGAIHALGPHPTEPLLDVNCGAFAEQLVESELFGHKKGAFTGANETKVGLLAAVGQGTLFLDEIAELPMALQTRLLRVLETRRFRAVGETERERTFSGRVVAATHADLHERVREQRFREDLLFRLNVLTIEVPPLDEHREDIPALVAHFAEAQPRKLEFTEQTLAALKERSWPGNIRQLRSFVERTAVFADEDVVTPATAASMIDGSALSRHDELRAVAERVLLLDLEGSRLQAVEEALVKEAMRRADGNKTAAARLLQVNRKAVERRLGRPEGTP